MSLVSPQVLYQHAAQNGYALGAFNVNSLESLQAVLEAAEAQDAPLIVQISMGARKYLGEHWPLFVQTMRRYAEVCKAPVFIQHDHCPSPQACFEAIDAGVQAVMFDGSHLPLEENIALTCQVVEHAHARGVWVEAELGRLPGFEDMVFAEHSEFTDPQTAARFVKATGCDALAVAVGTSHGGVEAEDYLPLDRELLGRIHETLGDLPLVLHGGASLPPALIEACNAQGGQVEFLRNCSEESISDSVSLGVRKVNMDVDNYLPFTTEVRRALREIPDKYDPRVYLLPARKAFRGEVEHKLCRVMHSAGQGKSVKQ
ncbi:MAG: class II fructose-bisphosphate aldolase [Oscillospiraceae bacterium]|nr:class II fructose-bisphosphate aldolase [Oscillospiraceae bacterium]